MNDKFKKILKKEIVKLPFESPSCFIPPNFETQMFLRLFCGQEVTGLVGRHKGRKWWDPETKATHAWSLPLR